MWDMAIGRKRVWLRWLKVAFTEDLSVFFNPADFAETALLNDTTLHGIFSQRSVVINHVETTAPVFTCKAIVAQHGDVLIINDIRYRIIGIHLDGTGIAAFILEQQ